MRHERPGVIREYQGADAAAVMRINAECVPEVGEMDDAKLSLLLEESARLLVAEEAGTVVGFLVGLDESSANYQSPNYRWFCDRHDSFAYVDRIAITETARGIGLGQTFYQTFRDWAVANAKPVMVAEVNTVPDNPSSHRFHQRFGFVDVARCRPYGPEEEVAMYEKQLP